MLCKAVLAVNNLANQQRTQIYLKGCFQILSKLSSEKISKAKYGLTFRWPDVYLESVQHNSLASTIFSPVSALKTCIGHQTEN